MNVSHIQIQGLLLGVGLLKAQGSLLNATGTVNTLSVRKFTTLITVLEEQKELSAIA